MSYRWDANDERNHRVSMALHGPVTGPVAIEPIRLTIDPNHDRKLEEWNRPTNYMGVRPEGKVRRYIFRDVRTKRFVKIPPGERLIRLKSSDKPRKPKSIRQHE